MSEELARSTPDASAAPRTVTQLMADLRRGKPDAANRLVELFYPELRKMAAARMKLEKSGHTWQTTVLVNELYLELRRIKALPAPGAEDPSERKAFFGLAGFLMRRLLIHHARPLYRRAEKIPLPDELGDVMSGEQTLTEIEDLLERLARIDPQLRQVVEMRVFEGLSREQIADRLSCSLRTVARHWEFARAWLQEAMSG